MRLYSDRQIRHLLELERAYAEKPYKEKAMRRETASNQLANYNVFIKPSRHYNWLVLFIPAYCDDSGLHNRHLGEQFVSAIYKDGSIDSFRYGIDPDIHGKAFYRSYDFYPDPIDVLKSVELLQARVIAIMTQCREVQDINNILKGDK